MAVGRLAGNRDRGRPVGRHLLAAAFAGCAALLSCSAGGREAALRVPDSGSLRQPTTLSSSIQSVSPAPGAWYLLDDGGLRPSDGPVDSGVPFLPWTVQSRIAGFLQMEGRLFLAVNGWGVVALAVDPFTTSETASFEDRALFAGRTINGIYADGPDVLVDLYRNTLFETPSPLSPPVSLARIDPADGSLTAEALPLTKAGWEASDVVHLPNGRWAMSWKRTTPRRIEFRYEMYAPENGAEQTMSRRAFFDSYGYRSISAAPRPLQAINAVIAETAGRATVIDYLVRKPALAWLDRYRAGPAKKLFAGDADLLTVPVFRDGSAYYALAADKVVVAGGASESPLLPEPRGEGDSAAARPQSIPLPLLPPGYAYTDLWCDGKQLVIAWERQRFTEVGAAGLFVRTAAPAVGARSAVHGQREPKR